MRLVIRGYFIGSKELIWTYRMWASGTKKKAKNVLLLSVVSTAFPGSTACRPPPAPPTPCVDPLRLLLRPLPPFSTEIPQETLSGEVLGTVSSLWRT